MSPMRAAVRAEQDQTWQGGLRISEVAAGSSRAPKRLHATPYAAALRSGLSHLLAGWRWLEGKRTQQLASRRLHLAETISLGEKRSVSIVRVDGAQYLIGCSSSSVQLLAVLDQANGESTRTMDEGKAS